MPESPTTELAMVETILGKSLTTAPSCKPGPGAGAGPSKTKAAVRRCAAAWQRAFDAHMENSEDEGTAHVFAALNADKAYRNAMPLLCGHEGVRDFIACAAHGILIGAILPDQSSQLLYAAQVALGVLHFERSQPNSSSK